MAQAELNGEAIVDWDSFHAESRRAFGFPDEYTNTMDAWVDCLSYLRDADGMSRFRLAENEVLTIVINGSAAMRVTVPEILEEMSFCIGGINERYEDYGEPPALRLELR
ncbi:MAG TPA: barstar family protein [Telluria sp.]